MTADELIQFESEIAELFGRKLIPGPIHLSDGNEAQLIEIFRDVGRDDWVFSTWRSHYHALLHGVDPAWLRQQIVAGRSISIQCPPRRFFTSAIVAGIIPIAVGTAMAVRRKGEARHVWAFVGDMTAELGTFHENLKYARNLDLPITFVVEDNGMCVGARTAEVWGRPACEAPAPSAPVRPGPKLIYYAYEKRKYPHTGIDRWVAF